MRALVIGATGSIGRRVVEVALRRNLTVRALVRDAASAEYLPSNLEIAEGDLERPESLVAAIREIDAIVFTHGSHGGGEAARRVDYGGVAHVLRTLDGAKPRIALMTSIYVTHRAEPDSATGQLLDWKRRSERLVRASGAPYSIVRPSWFDRVERGNERLVFEQGDTEDGGVGRAQIAEVLVRSLLSDAAVGKTFELFAAPGAAPADWDGLFADLEADVPGMLDGARDPDGPTLDAEPSEVQDDIGRLSAR